MGTKPPLLDWINPAISIGMILIGAYSAIAKSQRELDRRVVVTETEINGIKSQLGRIENAVADLRAGK